MKKRYYVSLVIVIGFFVLISPKVKGYILGYSVRNELYKASSTIDITDSSFMGLESLKKDVFGNKIFFVGEAHGTVKSYEMYLYLLKYFVEVGDVKYVLLEGGYSEGQYLNYYLDTGDESVLEYIFDKKRKTISSTMEKYNLFKNIYEYNLTLSEDKKIQFVGIDIENENIAIKYLNSLIPKSEILHSSIDELIKIVTGMSRHNYIEESAKALEILKANENEIKNYLGDNYFNFSFTLRNLSVSKGQFYREELLINNFIELYEQLPDGKYFGQYGGAHTNLHPTTRSFASHLQHNYDGTKNKVISIEYMYSNSYSYTPLPGNSIVKVPEIMEPYFFPDDKSTVLLKLNYEDSVYFNKNIHLYEGDPAVEYYQYIILLSDSNAANKYYSD